MKHILMRGKKSPFKAVDAATTLKNKVLGSNSGNLIFAQASHKLLSAKGVKVKPYRYNPDPDDAGMINETYDAFVIPLANAFRPSFKDALVNHTKLIRKLKIPVVVLGVGAQASLDYDFSRLRVMETEVKDFVSAVLDRSATIGVRGECTELYLKSLGFSSISVIGCPSLFMQGGDISMRPGVDSIDSDAKVAITISPYVSAIGRLVENHYRKYPNICYIPQNESDLDLMLNGVVRDGAEAGDKLPRHPSHPFFVEGKARFFLDPKTWVDFLKGYDFCFGTRIHGNIAGILAGTRSHVLAHDSRTLELARYFEIPNSRIDQIDPDSTDAVELYMRSDTSRLVSGHAERFERMVRFLELNGLSHIYQEGSKEALKAYEARYENVTLPGAVIPAASSIVA